MFECILISDTNSDGMLDEPEVEALFQKEVKIIYYGIFFVFNK